MKITGSISRVTVVRQADRYKRFAEQEMIEGKKAGPFQGI
jgi:hypothetical protein